MIMYFTKWILFVSLLLLITSVSVRGQENLTSYWQPQFAVNYQVAGAYSHNFAIANRNYVYENEDFTFRVKQLDFTHFSKLEIKDNQSIALGVMYRFYNIRENELRFTQQYNVTHKPFAIRFGHRFRAQQRITNSLTTHRFRYRFALDFPLMGEKLNPGEPYFVGSFENLLSVAKQNSPEYDIRLVGQVGWELHSGMKLQIGVEYRIEDYTASVPEHILFLLTSAQISL